MSTSLHDYASRGKLDKIIEKVGKGRNLDRQEPTYENTTLHIGAACGHLNVVKWCIEMKAKLNLVEHKGRTALALAALKGERAIAEALVQAGADVTIRDAYGKTARDNAADPPEWVPQTPEAVEGRKQIVALLDARK